MNKSLQVFKFDGNETRVVMKNGAPWWVLKDISDLLGYRDANQASRILEDDEKGTHKMSTPGGMQVMTMVNEAGIYSLILRSERPEAKAIKRWVTHEVLPALRKTGTYSVTSIDKESIAQKRAEAMLNNSRARLAKVLQSTLESPSYPLTVESKQILTREIARLATGKELVEMLPDSTARFYSAGEVGAEKGVSNRKVLKTARAMGLVAPEGESNEYGRWKMTKSPHSPHECSQWVFNEIGRKAVLQEIAA